MYYAGWQMIAEYSGAGSLQRKYVYGPGIDEPVRMTTTGGAGTNYFYHADGLGSVTEITGATGQLVESYRYDVYGTPAFLSATGTQQPASSIQNRLLFTGRDRDPDTTWYNYRYRYYNPTLGRFVQTDPIGLEAGDGNLYRYVLNGPNSWTDPFGQAVANERDFFGGGGGGGLGGTLPRGGGGGSAQHLRLLPAAPQPRALLPDRLLQQTLIHREALLSRSYDSRLTNPRASRPLGRSFCLGAFTPVNARAGIADKGLMLPGIVNNAQRNAVYRATTDIPALRGMALGGTAEELIIERQYWPRLELIDITIVPP
jgi:RHS repeat-associated protein